MKTTKILLITTLTLITHSCVYAEEFKSVWKYTAQNEIIDANGKENTAAVTKKEIIFFGLMN